MSGDSLPLVGGDGSTASQSDVFNQQGTIEWTNIANYTVTASVALLGRLASAGIEPLTVAVGQAICSDLVLGPTGERRLQESLNSLKSFSSFGDAIWFGLGIRHVLRTLVQTAQGASCVALTASLAEVHNVEVTALILYNLAASKKAPAKLSPSFYQWKVFAQTCASVFKTSSFSLRVQTLLSMIDEGSGIRDSPGACNPSDLAEVLDAVSMVKSGNKRSITVVGGADCAWVIAFADWLLTLRVLLHGRNGDLVYKNFDGLNHEAQVSAYYAIDQSLIGTNLRKTGESYVLRSGVSQIVQQLSLDIGELVSFSVPAMSMKVRWTEALSTSFNDEAVRRLLEHGAKINRVMTNALPIFQQSHEGLRYETNDLVHPIIENVVRWFPELKPLQQFGGFDNVKTRSADPYGEYTSSLKNLIHSCGCSQCCSAITSTTVSSSQTTNGPRVCLAALTETILLLCHLLARTVLDSALYPTVTGLRRFYQSMDKDTQYRLRILEDEMAPAAEIKKHLGQDEITRDLSQAEIYFVLFTGYNSSRAPTHPERWHGRECAASGHGICVYEEILLALSDQYSQASRIHVTAGVIETSGGTHETVYGEELESDYPLASALETSDPNTINTLNQWTSKLNVELVATTLEVLKVSYRVSNQQGNVWIDPMHYLNILGEVTQDSWSLQYKPFICPGHNLKSIEDLLSDHPSDHYLVQGIGEVNNIGDPRRWMYRPLLTMLSRCAALTSTVMVSDQTIIVGHNCLMCTRKAIVEHGIPTTERLLLRRGPIVAETAFIIDSLDCIAAANTTTS